MKKTISLIFLLIISCSLPIFAKDDSPIHVAYTIDNNYTIFTLLSINSILKNSNSNYHFYIIESNLTSKSKRKMKDFVENNNQIIEFINIDTDKINKKHNIYGYSSNRITPIAISRIVLSDILSKNIDKVLYLDGDTLITRDLSELYNTNLREYYAGMVSNIAQPETGLYYFKNGYFNSGVILIDLNKWRKDNIAKQMNDYLLRHIDKFVYKENTHQQYFRYPDQDLINIILDGKIMELPKNWNNQVINDKYLTSVDNKGIIHFVGPIKPWNFPRDNKDAVDLYFNYWDDSTLHHFKYYYILKHIKNVYLRICKIKFDRYCMFVQLMKECFLKKDEI